MNRLTFFCFLIVIELFFSSRTSFADDDTEKVLNKACYEYNQPKEAFVPVNTLNGIQPLPCILDEKKVKVFKLVAEEVHTRFCNASDCAPLRVWGYNGSMPGPTIEVYEGDTVRIEFENHLPEATTVHWHGLELPYEMDGAPHHLMLDPVPPGGSYTYEFTLHQHGTYFYHTGEMQAKQVGLGLGGLFIIHPKKPKTIVDKDYAMVLQIWRIPFGSRVPDTLDMSMFNWFTINGKVSPDVEYMRALSGQRVRVRVVNISMMTHPIHLHGHTFTIVEAGAGWIPESARWQANTVDISSGESRTFEFVATQEDGPWMFHCHFLHHIMNDMDKPPLPTDPVGGHESHMGVGGMHTVLDVFNPDE